VGTVVIDDATGSVAVRVSEDGLPLWVVVALDGGVSKDMQATLAGWNVVKSV